MQIRALAAVLVAAIVAAGSARAQVTKALKTFALDYAASHKK